MKKNEVQKTSFSESLKTVSATVALIISIGGVVSGALAAYTTYQLAPFLSRITQLETKVSAHEEQQKKDVDKLATKEQLDMVITDLGVIKSGLIKKGLQL